LEKKIKRDDEKRMIKKKEKIKNKLGIDGFWQARIEITQIPSRPSDHIKSLGDESKYDYLKSWLVDPFSDHNRTYCMELHMGMKFRLIFYITERSKEAATIKGYTFLTFLEDAYPGLSGALSVMPSTTKPIEEGAQLYELRFPAFKAHPNNRFIIFKRMIALIKHLKSLNVQFNIFWRTVREPLAPYQIKIFLKINPAEEHPNTDLHELLGRLQYVCMGFRKDIQYGEWIKREISLWNKIMTSNVLIGENLTCRGEARSFDFMFFPELPLKKIACIKNENIYNSLHFDNKKFILGNYVKNGVETSQKICMEKADFDHSVLICGMPKTGKTTFLSQIYHEFAKKAPEVGILIINVGKGFQEGRFPVDRIVRYGTSVCKIPYYVDGIYRAKCLQQTADYLAGSLGFEEPLNKIFLNVMGTYFLTKGHLPSKLSELFYAVVYWFEKNPYHIKYQTDILQAFNNRTKCLLIDDYLMNTTRLEENDHIPQWFTEWRAGKNIYIDLHPANLYSRRLLANAIFQMVQALTPEQEVNTLKYLICLDEAHNLVAAARGNISEEDMISRRQLGSVFTRLLQEFRGKGTSIIVVDQTPSDLLDSVIKFPSLRFVFREQKDDVELFTNILEEQEFLKSLQNRNVLVLNGSRGERFVMKTIDSNL